MTTPIMSTSIEIPAQTVTFDAGTIDTIAAAGLDAASAAQIDRSSSNMVLLLTYPGGNNVGLVLPDDAEIGDFIEMHNISAVSLGVYAPSGESGNGGLSDSNTAGVSAGVTKHFRKVGASSWRYW